MITGVEALLKDLNKKQTVVPTKTQQVIKKHGGELQREAMRLAPVAKVAGGSLKRSIELEILDGGYTAKVSPYMDYAVYQEYGTRYQSGTPYMRPAFYNRVKPFIDELKGMIK